MQHFYMTVGIPGSGKSYVASTLPGVVIHSSDAIREEILGDENDQTNQELVFKTLHERVLNDLSCGKDVVYDATNISYKRRMGFLIRVQALHRPALQSICLFMATPYEMCLARNKKRDRSVPEDVIKRMYHKIDVPMIAEVGMKSRYW